MLGELGLPAALLVLGGLGGLAAVLPWLLDGQRRTPAAVRGRKRG